METINRVDGTRVYSHPKIMLLSFGCQVFVGDRITYDGVRRSVKHIDFDNLSVLIDDKRFKVNELEKTLAFVYTIE